MSKEGVTSEWIRSSGSSVRIVWTSRCTGNRPLWKGFSTHVPSTYHFWAPNNRLPSSDHLCCLCYLFAYRYGRSLNSTLPSLTDFWHVDCLNQDNGRSPVGLLRRKPAREAQQSYSAHEWLQFLDCQGPPKVNSVYEHAPPKDQCLPIQAR